MDELLRQRRFRHNGKDSKGLTHYVMDLNKGYIYIWLNPDKRYYAFTYNKTSVAKGAENVFKTPVKFLQRLDEALATIK